MRLICSILLGGILFVYCHTCSAQNIDSIKNFGEGIQEAYWSSYSDNTIQHLDSVHAFQQLQVIYNVAQKEDNAILLCMYLLIKATYCSNHSLLSRDATRNLYLEVLNFARKNQLHLLECETSVCLMYIMFAQYGNHEAAFEYLLNIQEIFKEYYSVKEYQKELGIAMVEIGKVYCALGMYQEAFDAEKQAQGYVLNDKVLQQCYFYLGRSFAGMNEKNNPVNYYLSSLAYAAKIGDTGRTAQVSFCIGEYYFHKHYYDKAFPYLELAYRYSKNGNIPTMPAMAPLLEMAAINIDKGDRKLGEKQLCIAQEVLKQLPDDYADMVYYKVSYSRLMYYILSRNERVKGNYIKALQYQDSLIVYRDSLSLDEKQKKLKELEFRYRMENRRAEVKLLETKRAKQIQLRNAAIVILILITAITIQGFRKQVFKRKKEKEIYQLSLDHAKEQLMNYITNIQENSLLIEQLKAEIALVQAHTQDIDNGDEKEEVLAKLHKITILTEEDWDKFKILFEKVYKNFFIRLKEQFPDITQAEMRLVALTRLNLSTKEIANSLGISPESVRQSRWRLKKKMGVLEDTQLAAVLTSVDSSNYYSSPEPLAQ